ncbi:MAG: MotE family protein, partial [Pseudomonadota bacterium]
MTAPIRRHRRRVVTTVVTFALTAGAVAPPVIARAQDNRELLETARAYCSNLADAASDARFARKLARLNAVEADIEARLVALEEKRAEYESWLDRRQRFLRQAEDSLVTIYAGMRPDAASAQLAAMEELTAAAILAKVQPRTASAILNEMEADKAARLATIMSGMSRPS